MKPYLKLPAALALGTSLFFAACGDDDIDPLPPEVTNDAPELSLRNASGSDFSGAVTNTPINSRFALTVSASDVDNNLQSIRFERNGSPVTASSGFVTVDQDGDGTFENIASGTLAITSTSLYTETFRFLASQDFEDEVTYTIIVSDTEMEEASTDFTITTEAEPAPMTAVLDTSGVFFNRDGMGNGAFDLDSARAVRSTSMLSELQDAGLDQSTSPATWRKVIIAENGATIYRISDDDLTDFSYDALGFVEDIRDLRTRAVPYNPDGAETRTKSLVPGDLFLVEAGDNIYLVEVTDIVEDANSNDDRYEISYKYGPKDAE